jgi:hypothetical protein
MNTLTAFIEYGGDFYGVFTYRTQADTIAGTVWRFIMDGNKTIVAVPYQSPHAPAKTAHCVPERIESILAGGDFGFAVQRTAGANVENCGRTWEAEIHEATEAELRKWQAGRKWPALDKWEHDRAEAHKVCAERWKAAGLAEDAIEGKPPDEREAITKEVFAPLNEPERMKAVEKERAKRDAKRAEIEAKHRKRIEAEKTARAAEIEADALAELGAAVAAFGAKTPSKPKLKALFDFIREDVCRGERINPVISNADLRRVLAKVEELTGVDIAERVFLAYPPSMAAHLEECTRKTAEAEKIEEAEARRRVLERVRFVAAFPDRTIYPLQSASSCVHDERDAELFRLVAPDLAQRAEIETRLEAARRELAIKREGMKSAVPAEIGRPFNADEYGTQEDIKRTILGDGEKASRRKLWEANRERIEKEIPPVILPGGKRPEYHLPSVRAWFDRNKIRVQS